MTSSRIGLETDRVGGRAGVAFSASSEASTSDRSGAIERRLVAAVARVRQSPENRGLAEEEAAAFAARALRLCAESRSEMPRHDFAPCAPRVPKRPSPSAVGTRGLRIRPPEYFEEQQLTWCVLCAVQRQLMLDRACVALWEGRERLRMFEQRVPELRRIHQALRAISGWGIVRVDGYVPPAEFHAMLAAKRFPVMDLVRARSEMFYTFAPDMFHDVMGHLAALCSPELAELYHFFGLVGLEVETAEQQHWLQRIYVRAFEYGLLQRGGGSGSDSSILGAALATSLAELELAATAEVRRVPFEWEQVVTGPFDTYSPQSTLFVMPSLAWFQSAFGEWAKAEGLYPGRSGLA